jgi:hypothetical protein
MKKTPYFTYDLSHIYSNHCGWIEDGFIRIHKISDEMEFYQSLGYTEQMLREGMEAELFVWNQYRRSGCTSGQFCLQNKIIEYLIDHSDAFPMQYQEYLKSRNSQCDYYDNLIKECRDCRTYANVTAK